ncbi:hypothetical protein ACFW2V_12350 [Streptomyces sp. NPDC058947]|uniref:hypothetical protein n=1 Tax=Streptomyces sp. NPDC058947 TaxID=3346675 RepID=UPI0036A1C05F
MENARYFLGGVDPSDKYREVSWEEFHHAWSDAASKGVFLGGHYVCGPHAKGFYFHNGCGVVGHCYADGGAPDPAHLEAEKAG